jgi:rifampicin phosphotransferase
MADRIMEGSPQTAVVPIPLAECGRRPLAEVGAKARNLAEALAAGHPVPPGVVLPCRVLAGGVTDAVVEAAWEGARTLGEGPVAVRSSGVAEDGAEQSFAGQFQTVLNVRGHEEIEPALAEVAGSGRSSRASSGDQERTRQARATATNSSVRVIRIDACSRVVSGAHGAGRASGSGGQNCSRSSRSTDRPRRLRASRRSSGAASENRPGTLESASCTSTAMW